jgi:hypothetical protein
MAVFIEFVAGAGLAVFFHVVLHYEQLAFGIFGVGILLSLATWLLREDIEKTREHLDRRYQMAHEITFALAAVDDPECQAKARDLCAQTMRTIRLLQQGSIPLDQTEFYHEGAKCSDQARQQIKSVDPLATGWDKRDALANLLLANVHARERGIGVTRIFIANRGDLADPEAQQTLLNQINGGIDVRGAWREDLPASVATSSGDIESSLDFAVYDDRLVLDVYVRPGKYYGYKSVNPEKVSKYVNLFELIKHSAHAATEKDGELVV